MATDDELQDRAAARPKAGSIALGLLGLSAVACGRSDLFPDTSLGVAETTTAPAGASTGLDPGTDTDDVTGTPAFCGDNIASGSEFCDGIDLRGQDCITLGFGGGTTKVRAGAGDPFSAPAKPPPPVLGFDPTA